MNYSTLSGSFIYVLLWLGVFVCLCIYNSVKKRKFKLPPGPTGLPFFGYLPFLGDNPHVKLHELGQKFGNVFSLYLGRKHVIVVTDAALAKQLFSNQSTLDRPENLFLLLPGGAGFGETNGERWIEQRRYSVKEMKKLGRGGSDWEKLLEMEVSDFLDILKKSQGQPTDIYMELSASISNSILSFVSNQRLPSGHPKRDIIDKGVESFFLISSQSGLISNYPKLFKFCAEFGLINVGQKLEEVRSMSRCIRQQIEELEHETDGDSYIHRYFTEIKKNKQFNLGNSFDDANLVGNVQALILGGSDLTRVSLLWLFLAMASFPHIQEKVHEEIDTVLGKDGHANWTDRNKLPYCYATIMEAQRWRTIAPLSVLRRTNEDIFFNGYDIPKGAYIIALISAFHTDTKYWKDPDTFQPERFLEEDGKRLKTPDSYLPFSSGKRSCPGKTVAYIELFHYLVPVIQKFRILPASENTKPDLVGNVGLTFSPKRQPLRYVLR